MAADAPTIVAASAGFVRGERGMELGGVMRHAIELAGTTGRPRLCHVGTAAGDQLWHNAMVDDAARRAGIDLVHLNLFPMPPSDDLDDYVGGNDVVWVNGGSVANLLAVWRVHGLDDVLRRAWENRIVLGGISAGSICWHAGGTTDSFGPNLRVITNGLGFLPYGNGVHYDSEAQRRPAVQRAVATGELPKTYCTDDGAALVYRDTALVEAIAERQGPGAYVVDGDTETRLDVRVL